VKFSKENAGEQRSHEVRRMMEEKGKAAAKLFRRGFVKATQTEVCATKIYEWASLRLRVKSMK